MEELLSAPYNAARRRLIGERASHEVRPGQIAGHGGAVAAPRRRRADLAHAGAHGGIGEPTVARRGGSALAGRGDTCHLDVIDRHGNMVSATPCGGWLQSSPVIPGLGFCLGTRGQMFWLEEGLPASLAPGKRPRTDALALARAARRRALSGLRHARRRPAGPVVAARLPAPRPFRHEPAGGDRRAGLPHRACAELVLSARGAPGPSRARGPLSARRRSRSCAGAATSVEVTDDWALGRVTAAARDGELLKAAANPRHMQNYAIGR